jgi:nondiscriminating glutamyl-tRNA synthetase
MDNVRVRFAPSPTGYLHVGGLRTALYNYLFAKRNGGTMVLRIEDTDRNRYVEGAVDNLRNTLKNSGINYDEGPDKGGDFGPYTQSERQQLYVEHCNQLLASGKAYKCFCTPERLDEMRAKQQAAGEDLRYDGHCRNLATDEIAAKEAAGLPYTVRLKVPENQTVRMTDLIRGDIAFDTAQIDDQILLKSDGYPTYHLANVVDDHHMRISHVIRGEEWLPSTPKHILMYQAFGWDLPQFAHLPLLLNPDRSKLSKRQGDVAVEDYLAKGYLADALVNYVALLGWNPGTDQELFTLTELTEAFNLDKVNKAGAVFDVAKLRWMNSQYLKKMEEEAYLELLRPVVAAFNNNRYGDAVVDKIALAIRNNIEYASQATDFLDVFYREDITPENAEANDMLKLETSQQVFAYFLDHIDASEEWTSADFKKLMKDTQKAIGVKGKNLFMPMRIALSGQMHGPDLTLYAEIIGRGAVRERIEKVR